MGCLTGHSDGSGLENEKKIQVKKPVQKLLLILGTRANNGTRGWAALGCARGKKLGFRTPSCGCFFSVQQVAPLLFRSGGDQLEESHPGVLAALNFVHSRVLRSLTLGH